MSEKNLFHAIRCTLRKLAAATFPAARTTVTACLATALVAGCGTTWTGLDGGTASEAKLERALEKCRVERKLEGLARAEEERKRELRQAASNQQKMTAKENYAEIERQVYREIDICMHGEGFRRRG